MGAGALYSGGWGSSAPIRFERPETMKTVHAPETLPAYLDAARDLAAANPLAAYALGVMALAWAAHALRHAF